MHVAFQIIGSVVWAEFSDEVTFGITCRANVQMNGDIQLLKTDNRQSTLSDFNNISISFYTIGSKEYEMCIYDQLSSSQKEIVDNSRGIIRYFPETKYDDKIEAELVCLCLFIKEEEAQEIRSIFEHIQNYSLNAEISTILSVYQATPDFSFGNIYHWDVNEPIPVGKFSVLTKT